MDFRVHYKSRHHLETGGAFFHTANAAVSAGSCDAIAGIASYQLIVQRLT
jgi:hypothetical protein